MFATRMILQNARAQPLARSRQTAHQFPGSIVPPGTSFVTRKVPESFQEIAEFVEPFFAPHFPSAIQVAIALHAKLVENFAEPCQDIAQARKIARCGFGERHASGAAACARTDVSRPRTPQPISQAQFFAATPQQPVR